MKKLDPQASLISAYGALVNPIVQEGEDKFKAPENIITSLSTARSIFTTLRTNNIKRNILYSEIHGLLQGNPPYKQADLDAAGISSIANFNDMSPRTIYERQCLAFWNLLFSSEYFITFILSSPQGDANTFPEALKFAVTFAKNWKRAVEEKWPDFYTCITSMQSQLVELGVSPVIFSDERSPKWRSVELARFYIPNQSQDDLSLLDKVFVETEMSLAYLWNVFTSMQTIKEDDTPWNCPELGRILARTTTINSNANNQMFSDYQPYQIMQHMLSKDCNFDMLYTGTIRVVSLFQKEYSGKFSHYMFIRDPIPFSSEFIFFQSEQYDSIEDFLVLFTLNPGERIIHENKGFGHKIFSLAQAKIQLDCSVVDLAKFASTPIIQSPPTNHKDINQIRIYPGIPVNIGAGVLQNNNLGANLNGVVSAANYLTNLMEFNLTYSGSDSGSPDPDKGSLNQTQTMMSAMREFGVLKNTIQHHYQSLDKVLYLMTARMFNSKESDPDYELGERWRELCILDGVPPELFKSKGDNNNKLPDWMQVRATRALGAGSQAALLFGLQQLQSIGGSFTKQEEKAYKDLMVIAALGPEAVGVFSPDSISNDENSGGASLAFLENEFMQAGKQALFSPDNDHRAHAPLHMSDLVQMTKALQQGQFDPVQADSVYKNMIPHTEQHLQALERNPFTRSLVSELIEPFNQIKKYAELNRKNVARMLQKQAQEQQQAVEEQQQVMSKEQLEEFKVQKDEERKDFKLAQQNKRQEQQHALKQTLAIDEARSKVITDREKIQLEAENAKKKIFLITMLK